MTERAIQKYQPGSEGNNTLVPIPKDIIELALLLEALSGGESLRFREETEINYAENWDGQGSPPMLPLQTLSDEALITAGLMVDGTARDVTDKKT